MQADGTWTKVCAFQTFYGTAGPDGLALDSYGRLLVAHPGLGCLFVLGEDGGVRQIVKGPTQRAIITNVAIEKDRGRVVMTDSRNGAILEASLPKPMDDEVPCSITNRIAPASNHNGRQIERY